MSKEKETKNPPNDAEDDDDIFQSFEEMLETIPTAGSSSGFMVVDEVGCDSDEEPKQKVTVKVEKESPKEKKPIAKADPNNRIVKRSSDIRRSRSPRRRRSPPRRSPARRRPSKERGADRKPARTTGGGAASFLADLKKQLGTFEELEKVEKETGGKRRSPARDPRSYRDRGRNQKQQQQQQIQQQQNYLQYPNMMMNTMQPMPLMNDPMCMMNGMPMMGMPMNMGMMPYPNNMMMGPPGVDQPQMFQQTEMGMMPTNYPMIMQQQQMMQTQMPMQQPVVDETRRRDRSRSRGRRSRSPHSRNSKSSGRRNSRSPKRRRSRSRDRHHRSSSKEHKRSSRGISQSSSTTNPPIRKTNIDLSEITSQLFLDNKIGLSDYLQTKTSGTPTTNYSRPIDNKLPLSRVISKLRAATHILENRNDLEYNMKFLFVPPKYSSDSKNAAAASPVFPTKHNPLFRATTERPDLVSESRPFPIVPIRVTELVRLLGIDESVIANQLESNVVTEEFFEAREREAGGNMSNGGVSSRGLQQRWSPVPAPKPEMVDISTQTPSLCCRRCEERDHRKVCGVGTQTKHSHQLNETTQTSETEFTLAKLRFKPYDKDFAVSVKSEYTRAREEGTLRLGPPGSTSMMPSRRQDKTYSFRFT